jgi:hypothetical protein
MAAPFDKNGIFMNSELVAAIRKNDTEEIRISVLKNNKIDVRLYASFSDGAEPSPTKKGAWLSFKHVPVIVETLGKIAEGKGDAEEVLEETDKGKLKVYSADFKGRKYVHIRNFYLENGEYKPGKGVSFSADAVAAALDGFKKLSGRKE